MSSHTSAVRPTRPSAGLITAGLVGAAVVATALNAAIAAIAHAAGASSDFQALQLPTYTTFTVLGVVAAAAGWAVVRARATRPRRLLRWLVPTVLLVSLVPDVLVGASGSMPGTSWGAVGALMAMHVAVTAVILATYPRLLPLQPTAGHAR